MFEMLEYQKETDNKYRWDNIHNGVKFELYIPKWRVPNPKPNSVYVEIFDKSSYNMDFKKHSRSKYENNEELKKNKIIAHVKWIADHTKTARFNPVVDSEEAEIGSLYVPFDLLPNRTSKELIIEVCWK
ncbi:MAG: hypothetical protein GXY97_06980 [Clostridiales bacterium]|jgi:hypothetical protein|nr:hypothetical protein [Clostridiales bacterium]NLX86866.1 hypothetical protein [Clostridiales bacterium]NLZ92340.1 hypothetical protein [Clostridiales bacterium]